jgi:ferredoxin
LARQQIGNPVSPNTDVGRESARYGESGFAHEPHNAQTQSFVDQPMGAFAARTAEAATSASAATAAAPGPVQRVRPIAVVEPAEACLGCGTCATACRRGAITINLQATPAAQIDVAACTGCGRCVAACAEHIIVLQTP